MFVNDILCLVQGFLDQLVSLLNSALGSLLNIEIPSIDVGCEVSEEV
jgi:hypothetical protein